MGSSPWKFVDEAEPPEGEPLVWNGEHVSVARRGRCQIIAVAEGIDVLDPSEKPVIIKGVTQWDIAKPSR